MHAKLISRLPTEERVFRVVGELDVASVAALRDELRLTIDLGSGPVMLDLTAMTFIDAAGISVLVWFANEMRTRGRRASFCGASPMTGRLLELTHVEHLFARPAGVPTW